jgi:DNA-binding response OmpR family regulator
MATDSTLILVVEDDPNIADLVELYLRRDGYRVRQEVSGEAALEAVATHRPELIVLDLGLAGSLDGLEVCRRVRATSDLPILVLTARDDEIDRVLGFELGADDYVTKPFSPRELVARIKAILRRAEGPPRRGPAVLRVGAVELDTGRREVRILGGDGSGEDGTGEDGTGENRTGTVVAFATREFDLLQYLFENRGLALTRRQLLDGVWGTDWVGDDRTVDVHVRQLRKKLGDALPLDTVWGVGYRLD